MRYVIIYTKENFENTKKENFESKKKLQEKFINYKLNDSTFIIITKMKIKDIYKELEIKRKEKGLSNLFKKKKILTDFTIFGINGYYGYTDNSLWEHLAKDRILE